MFLNHLTKLNIMIHLHLLGIFPAYYECMVADKQRMPLRGLLF
jgi:hypothetical protein